MLRGSNVRAVAGDEAPAGDDSGNGNEISVGRHHHYGGHENGRSNGHEAPERGAGDFDYYIFSMSYQPEFCRENNEKFDRCHKFDERWEGQLTIHGLWPSVSVWYCYLVALG